MGMRMCRMECATCISPRAAGAWGYAHRHGDMHIGEREGVHGPGEAGEHERMGICICPMGGPYGKCISARARMGTGISMGVYISAAHSRNSHKRTARRTQPTGGSTARTRTARCRGGRPTSPTPGSRYGARAQRRARRPPGSPWAARCSRASTARRCPHYLPAFLRHGNAPTHGAHEITGRR